MEIDQLAELVLAQQDAIDKLLGQNTAFRTALLALIVSHPDRPALVERFEQMRARSDAQSLYAPASDAVLSEAERVLDELSRPWRDQRSA